MGLLGAGGEPKRVAEQALRIGREPVFFQRTLSKAPA